MTPQQELTLLETAYSDLVTGGVKSYSINGRQVNRNDIAWIAQRMDQLRAIVARQQTGMFRASQFRNPE